MSTAQYKLEYTTDPDIIKFNRVQNSEVWRGPMTPEEYNEREEKAARLQISLQDHSNYAGLYCFSFKDLSLPDNGGKLDQIVAACETLNKRAWVVVNGELKEIIAPCVGGVYTLPQHRKKGYAEKMISAVNEYWKEKLPSDTFMFLMSEVGPFYERCGYIGHAVPVLKVQYAHTDNYKLPFDEEAEGVEYLGWDNYEDLIIPFHDRVKAEIVELSKQNKDKHIFSLVPNMNQLTWFHLRDLHCGAIIGKNVTNSKLGVKLDKDNFMVWFHEWDTPELKVTKLQATSLENLIKLIQLGVQEAKNTDFAQLYIWESSIPEEYKEQLSEYLKVNFPTTKFSQVNTSIPSIMPLDDKVREEKSYIWAENDKWGWY
ncbi:hypothetical protein WICPIJ_000232 [Wickerhamomyces pijperi]|uniref:LYC1 C-terminal domain-containing protein n=1 Tax=Wickerhamomyces pijperi TaxID=599730 RepID=A0A9P8TR16_WICPI|nr:hypothetical protein WICPIJ_000232 [Wickerhamomyces pijperi]